MSRGRARDRGAIIALCVTLVAIAATACIENLAIGRGSAIDTLSPHPLHYGVFTIPDTLAQWIMAILAVIATAISGWAVFLVRETLDQNRRATNAAIQAVEVAERSLLTQLRPWMIGNGVSVLEVNGATSGKTRYEKALGLEAIWVNSGQSPATSASVHTTVAEIPMGGTVPVFESQRREGTVTIGNGSMLTGIPTILVGEALDKFMRREIDVIVHTRVDYAEALNPTANRYSEATYRCCYNGVKILDGGIEQVRLEVSPVGPQNVTT